MPLFEIRESQKGILSIKGEGEVPLDEVIEFLQDVQHAYNSLIIFERTLTRIAEAYRKDALGLIWSQLWRVAREEQAEAMVASQDRLILQSVQIESPGVWEFLGSLNPLDVLRKYLNDQEDRRRNREFRDEAERRKLRAENERLEIENTLLEVEGMKKLIEVAKAAGAKDEDLTPIVEQLVHRPIRKLGQHQNKGLIGEAKLIESKV